MPSKLLSKVLVTGGAGYIGSHTCVALLLSGYEVVVLDNLSNSSEEALKRTQLLAGKSITFYKVDLLDETATEEVFVKEKPDAVIHFAGLKAVGESCRLPLMYYHNNITGSLILLRVMERQRCFQLVFSSSATVYGDPHTVPIKEDFPLFATNPYGRTKLQIEDVLRDVSKADARWKVTILRYFNPVGAHESGLIGEDPDVPNNLMPYVQQVAVGRRPFLNVFGHDYPTVDGTGVRDFIHVCDLAEGHIAALRKLAQTATGCCIAYNLGTGLGISVLQLVAAMRKASGRDIPVKLSDRRPGDIGVCYADSSLAAHELGWRARFGLDEMVRDAWKWQSDNPYGYRQAPSEPPAPAPAPPPMQPAPAPASSQQAPTQKSHPLASGHAPTANGNAPTANGHAPTANGHALPANGHMANGYAPSGSGCAAVDLSLANGVQPLATGTMTAKPIPGSATASHVHHRIPNGHVPRGDYPMRDETAAAGCVAAHPHAPPERTLIELPPLASPLIYLEYM